MAKLANRAKMTISSTGTGNITLASAVAGYQSFLDAGVSDGDRVRYIVEQGADWEIGTAAVSNNSTVLVRTVEESSAANNAALNLTSSAKVFIGVTANDLDNAAPIFTTTPPTSLLLQNDGSTAVTLTAKAYDEAGIPISYDWDAWASGGTTIYDASSLPPQLASAPSINQSTGVYSLVGSSNSNNAGIMNFRVKASDGVKVATNVTSCDLSFFTNINLANAQTRASNTLAATTTVNQLEISTNTLSTNQDALYFPEGAYSSSAPNMAEGKRYLEIKWTGGDSNANRYLIGIGDRNALHTNATGTGYAGSSCLYMYLYDGTHYGANTSASGLGSHSVNDIIQIAYDTNAGKVWMGKNNTWSNQTGTPASGSGISLSYANGYALCVADGWSAGTNIILQLQHGNYTMPTGFSRF